MWRIPMVGNVCCDTVASRGTWGACGQLPAHEHHNCATWPWLGLPCIYAYAEIATNALAGRFPLMAWERVTVCMHMCDVVHTYFKFKKANSYMYWTQ